MAGPSDLRRQVAGAFAAIALAAAALTAAEGVGGSEARPATALAQVAAGGYERVTIGPGNLEPAAAPAGGGAVRAAGGKEPLELAYYIGVDFQEVPPGGAQLFEIRCPASEHPIAGGTFAPVAGLLTVSSSRVNPSPAFTTTRPRAWYEGVVNIMSTPLRWKPFVTCGTAKGVVK